MWNKKIWIGLLAVSASMGGAAVADEGKDQAAVAKLLPSAKVTLSRGLMVSESKGQPISGKFEVGEGPKGNRSTRSRKSEADARGG